jgi:hypothetical protein
MPKRLLAASLFFAAVLFAGQTGSGSVACPASGAKQVATSSFKVSWLIIQSAAGNSGLIAVGDSTITTTTGGVLAAGTGSNPGDSIMLPALANTYPYDLSTIYFACANSGDKITYVYQR